MTITDLPDADIASASIDSPSFRFHGIPLPRGLREDADAMSWSTFTATYAPIAGPLSLGHWERADTGRPTSRYGSQPQTYHAKLALGDRVETATATATGPVAALTAMLHDHGVAVEMLQLSSTAVRRHDRHLHPGHRRLPGRMGDGLLGGPHRFRAVRGDRLREPALRRKRLENPGYSGRSTIGMPSIGIGMPP